MKKLLVGLMVCGAALSLTTASADIIDDIWSGFDVVVDSHKSENATIDARVSVLEHDINLIKAILPGKTRDIVVKTRLGLDSTEARAELDSLSIRLESLESELAVLSGSRKDEIIDSLGEGLKYQYGISDVKQNIINNAVKYLGGNIYYSQGYGRGVVDGVTGYLDCSSFVFMVMRESGYDVPLGSTETMFSMVGETFIEIDRSEVKPGDIFVSGTPGMSSGDAGHTGIFITPEIIIHCSTYYGDNRGSGNIYVAEYPEGDFGLEPHFYRIVEAE